MRGCSGYSVHNGRAGKKKKEATHKLTNSHRSSAEIRRYRTCQGGVPGLKLLGTLWSTRSTAPTLFDSAAPFEKEYGQQN